MTSPNSQYDIVLLSNGPGEVLTWVKPVVQQIRQQLTSARISVILNPCPHASGKEYHMVTELLKVDRALAPAHFKRFLLQGRTPDQWQWHRQGCVLFLGGDQLFSWLIAKRLGYQSLVYVENTCRWLSMNNRFLSKTNHPTARTFWPYFKKKIYPVGDLLQDCINTTNPAELEHQWQPLNTPNKSHYQISLLPGSKPAKLNFMVPYGLAIADALSQQLTNVSFVMPIPPNITPQQLQQYAKKDNPALKIIQGSHATLTQDNRNQFYLQTEKGTLIYLYQRYPAYQQLAASDIAITTIGTITHELAQINCPMLVLSPLILFSLGSAENYKHYNGLLGLLARTPIIGLPLLKLLGYIATKKANNFAWPNVNAKKEVVPEIKTYLTPEQLADKIQDLLQDKNTIATMRQTLKAANGKPGTAKKIIDHLKLALNYQKH